MTVAGDRNQRITATLLEANVEVYAANIGTRPLNDPSSFTAQIVAAMRVSHPMTGRYEVN